MELNERQRRAVRYYEGDVCGSDPFWGDPKAYVTLNALFFPGIDTERIRSSEGKRLNPAILAKEDRLMDLLADLWQACRSQTAEQEDECFRVERYADYQKLRAAGRTISFTSTSTAGFLPDYYDRSGIVLMRIRIPRGTPCLNMAGVLPLYKKADEAEILLPPGLSLKLTESEPDGEEMRIRDADGQPPIRAVQAEVCADGNAAGQHISFKGLGDTQDHGGVLRRNENGICENGFGRGMGAQKDTGRDRRGGMRVYEAFNAHREPEPEDVCGYLKWKAYFIAELYRRVEHANEKRV